MRKRVSRVRGSIGELVDEMFVGVEDKEGLSRDIRKWMEVDVLKLPAFNEDGSVVLYEVGGVLLGKSALIRFMERLK